VLARGSTGPSTSAASGILRICQRLPSHDSRPRIGTRKYPSRRWCSRPSLFTTDWPSGCAETAACPAYPSVRPTGRVSTPVAIGGIRVADGPGAPIVAAAARLEAKVRLTADVLSGRVGSPAEARAIGALQIAGMAIARLAGGSRLRRARGIKWRRVTEVGCPRRQEGPFARAHGAGRRSRPTTPAPSHASPEVHGLPSSHGPVLYRY
jgi:hypothetical protein